MRKLTCALILAAAPISAAQAQNMPVGQFLAKAEALQKKGAMALLSSDIGRLKKEIQNSGKAVRAEHAALIKAGKKSPYCMPEKASFNSGELLSHFRAIPQSQRNMPVKAAFAGFVQKKYPCPS